MVLRGGWGVPACFGNRDALRDEWGRGPRLGRLLAGPLVGFASGLYRAVVIHGFWNFNVIMSAGGVGGGEPTCAVASAHRRHPL